MDQHTETTLLQEDDQRENIKIKLLILKYLRYWPYFVLTVALALAIGYIINRYTTKIYHTDAKMKVLEVQNYVDFSGFQGANTRLGMQPVNLENEAQILKSRKLLDSVAQSLKLNVLYYSEGDVSTSEIWKKEVPFMVRFDTEEETKSSPDIAIDFTSSTHFELSLHDQPLTKKAKLNDTIEFAGYRFSVSLNPEYSGNYTKLKGSRYLFKYVSNQTAINSISANLTVSSVGKFSDILQVSYEGPIKAKNEAILDTLMGKFNQDGIRDKQLISKRAGEFVSERLKSLVKELDTIESKLVDFKQSNEIFTIESTAKQLYGKESSAEEGFFELQNQKAVTESFKKELQEGDDYQYLPAKIGIESGSINSLTQEYNESISVLNKLMNSATDENPVVISTKSRLDKIKANILRSVDTYIQSLDISLSKYQNRKQESTGRLSTIPAKEKQVKSIERQHEIKEELYLFLLQKREEAGLRYATTSPTIKVVDYAYSKNSAVYPQTDIIYLGALVAGLIIPFVILYISFLFNTKVESKEAVERMLLNNIPILAEIPKIAKNANKLIVENDRSILAESFRILRTNLKFFGSNKSERKRGEIIFVTSSIKGEGKTFTSVNLANTLASTGKKTLLMGGDLRNPQTHKYFGLDKNQLGISNYATDSSLNFEDIVIKNVNEFDKLDLVLSGHIPPNPVNLLIGDRFKELMERAKEEYDYIIVDTAPTILVTDTLLISEFADSVIYLIRIDVTELKLLGHINDVYRTGKLKNMGIAINELDKKSGYGYSYNYGYGYGYYSDESTSTPWWKFWK